MAITDYILCQKCQCKLVYDGDLSNRKWLKERFGTEDLICPSCLLAAIPKKFCDYDSWYNGWDACVDEIKSKIL